MGRKEAQMKKFLWIVVAVLVAICAYEVCRKVLPRVIEKRRAEKARRGEA